MYRSHGGYVSDSWGIMSPFHGGVCLEFMGMFQIHEGYVADLWGSTSRVHGYVSDSLGVCQEFMGKFVSDSLNSWVVQSRFMISDSWASTVSDSGLDS
ncbi:hypothetical protein QJS04_geneDACA016363 [Acorus gramineus]|uniref:Uncharacterized protein n=1 Tax=Acorus gramineus TaxID=55184 RepID=A0AAV9ATT4_ACOGR|nr:hypothetical protein QJS04_geneDACA016363 [Acorus gramineus]